MTRLLERALLLCSLAALAQLLATALLRQALLLVGWRAVGDHVRRRPLRDYDFVARSPLTLPVSILLPAHNQAPAIVPAVRALLGTGFGRFEVIVIDGGSTDGTLAALREAFGLVEVERVPRAALRTAPPRALYASRAEPRLLVLERDGGGRAESLNAGIEHARYPLLCALDAATSLDPGALSRLVWEFQADQRTVAVGGIVRVRNGSPPGDRRPLRVRSPDSLLERLQVLEYLQAFLGGHLGWSRLGLPPLVPGWFGLLRRDAVVAIGGYDATTGEDAELLLRLHRRRRERGEPCRVVCFPDPICWTEAPRSLGGLVRQRDRWQRGLIETLWRHRAVLANPRHGRVGLWALPYLAVFEAAGPAVEALGYLTVPPAAALGLLSPALTALVIGLAVSHGLLLSLATVLMEQRAFRRHPPGRDLARLLTAAVLQNLGYRQLLVLVRARAWWTLLRDRGGRLGDEPATIPRSDQVGQLGRPTSR